ncbi:MAG TPA: glucose 1-dehydrogenase [Bryobacteraceae bacterium]|nr:glucose 1-dehydrogenase [Bryobacteraceae bacterium]
MTNCFDLNGRVAVVVGATSGIGRQIALGLADHGADVIPAGRRAAEVQKVCREIEKRGRRSAVLTVNVTNRDSIEALRHSTVQALGGVDILVNAAAFTERKPTLAVSDREWTALLDTNLQGVLRTCQIFHPALQTSGRGRIINIASLGSYVAFHEVAAYCASKSAILSLTRSLGCEWARDRICVNAIAPGVFPTELNRALLEGTERGKEILVRTPMKRFGAPEELVGAAVLLASDGASFITGQCIVVDGGYLASGVNS